ncbi:MAG: hypothetical protein IKD76_00965 [Clostridia bacterium]|nr:hypothetical protein [Clostridia bacterium]
MLHIVKSIKTGRNGVVDDVTGKLIVPLNYSKIAMQKYGIVAERSDASSDAFSFTGTELLRDCRNMLFLEDNLIISSLGVLMVNLNG